MYWQEIEKVMHTLENPTGGFSPAHRGIVTMSDGMKVFVKTVGADENKRWIQKEIAVYLFLLKHNYAYVPKLLACNAELTGFALEALTTSNGWNWADTWDEARVDATLHAMDELATITPSEEEKEQFGTKSISKATDGWQYLRNDPGKQTLLRKKLLAGGRETLAATLDIQAMANRSAMYPFKDDIVVHHDIRADNCAWHPQTHTVALIDWEWAQLGDRTIDRNAMLAHVYKSGLQVLTGYRDLLDPAALEWLAGFWLNASTNPLPAGSHNQHVRSYQLASGIAALDLAAKLT